MADPKSILVSKTFWVNLLGLLTLVLPLLGAPQVLDPEVTAGLLAVVNLVLRFLTKGPVSL